MMNIIFRNELGEIDLNSMNISLRESKGLDTLNNEIISTQSKHGSTYTDNRIEEREIELNLRIKTYSIDYENLKRKIIRLFNPNIEGELVVNDKKIKVRVIQTPSFEKTDYITIKDCILTLVALDPYWTDLEKTKTEIVLWKGSFHFPLIIPEEGVVIGYREPSLIVNTENIGDIKCGMIIEFKALSEVVNPKLLNINTSEYIKINKTMLAGEKIIVTTDFSNKKVYSNVNGVIENAFNYLDLYSTFLQLEIGDNLFRYDAESGLDKLEVTIYHTSRYLGV